MRKLNLFALVIGFAIGLVRAPIYFVSEADRENCKTLARLRQTSQEICRKVQTPTEDLSMPVFPALGFFPIGYIRFPGQYYTQRDGGYETIFGPLAQGAFSLRNHLYTEHERYRDRAVCVVFVPTNVVMRPSVDGPISVYGGNWELRLNSNGVCKPDISLLKDSVCESVQTDRVQILFDGREKFYYTSSQGAGEYYVVGAGETVTADEVNLIDQRVAIQSGYYIKTTQEETVDEVLQLLGAPSVDMPNPSGPREIRYYTITREVFRQMIDILITPGTDGIGLIEENAKKHGIKYTKHTGLPSLSRR